MVRMASRLSLGEIDKRDAGAGDLEVSVKLRLALECYVFNIEY
jgi:hypothetical protein